MTKRITREDIVNMINEGKNTIEVYNREHTYRTSFYKKEDNQWQVAYYDLKNDKICHVCGIEISASGEHYCCFDYKFQNISTEEMISRVVGHENVYFIKYV